jgi:membrane protease YdiL (CAAX protease family)
VATTRARRSDAASGPRAVRALMGRHPVLVFFALAYLISWSWWVPLVLRGEVVRAGVGWPTHLPGLAGPAVAAILVTAILDGRQGLRDLGRRAVRWRVGWWWWVVVAATFGLAALGAVQALVRGGDVPSLADFTRYTGVGSISPIGVVVMVLVLNGLGEETGWRGFAVERLIREHDLRWTRPARGSGLGGLAPTVLLACRHVPVVRPAGARLVRQHAGRVGGVGAHVLLWASQHPACRRLAHGVQLHLGHLGAAPTGSLATRQA